MLKCSPAHADLDPHRGGRIAKGKGNLIADDRVTPFLHRERPDEANNGLRVRHLISPRWQDAIQVGVVERPVGPASVLNLCLSGHAADRGERVLHDIGPIALAYSHT